jgi:hypothetical protein
MVIRSTALVVIDNNIGNLYISDIGVGLFLSNSRREIKVIPLQKPRQRH